MDCRELVNKCTGDRRCPVESFQQRALADFSPSTPAVLQVFSRRAVGPAIILRPAAVLLSCSEIHTLAMRSSRIFAKHARAASGILKPRSRPDNISATGCRAAENTRAPDVLWSNFRQARPRRFRYSQDAQSAWQLFCDWLPSCCKIHTLSTTFTACSVSFSTCLFAAIAYFPVAASPGPVFFGRSSAGNS